MGIQEDKLIQIDIPEMVQAFGGISDILEKMF